MIENSSPEGELEGLKAYWVLTCYTEEYEGVSDGMKICGQEKYDTLNPMDVDESENCLSQDGGEGSKEAMKGDENDHLSQG